MSVRLGAMQVDVCASATEAAYAALPNNEGVCLGDIPAEVLKVGGSALACKYPEVNERVVKNSSWPSQWRGGRVVKVFRTKVMCKNAIIGMACS